MRSGNVIQALYVCSIVENVYLSFLQAGARLFGFVGAGATLGQLFGSLFAAGFAWLGPCMYCNHFLIKKYLVLLEVRSTEEEEIVEEGKLMY